jgi:hypothetical protein
LEVLRSELGWVRVVAVMKWMRVRGEKAAVTLCVATSESKRGDVVCTRAFKPVLLH